MWDNINPEDGNLVSSQLFNPTASSVFNWKVVDSSPAGARKFFSEDFNCVLVIYFIFITLGGWLVP